MKSFKIFLALAMLMAIVITLRATPSDEEDQPFDEVHNETSELMTSLRGAGRFLASKPRGTMTCDKYPRICRVRGSPGRDCCKKKCVDVQTDRLNCGKCGKKCKYSEICCKGKCVNPMFNGKHCGGCYNKCQRGNSCLYGMCSYA